MRKFVVTGLMVAVAVMVGAASVFAQDTGTSDGAETTITWLGIGIAEADDQIVVIRVQNGSPADAADLIVGDVIVAYDGEAVDSAEALAEMVATGSAGDTVSIDVLRNDETVSIEATLGSSLAREGLHGRDLDGDPNTIEAYYDTALDITWLANANLATTETFGIADIRSEGRTAGGMSWQTAHAWIDAMNSAAYLGITDWRLPNDLPMDPEAGLAINPDNEGYYLEFSTSGTSDGGFAIQGEGWVDNGGVAVSELGHLFYVSLNNLSPCVPDFETAIGDDLRCLNDTENRSEWPEGSGLTNTGPFINLGEFYYWAEQEDPRDDGLRGRGLNFTTGFRISLGKDIDRNRAWPVVSGDIGVAVP